MNNMINTDIKEISIENNDINTLNISLNDVFIFTPMKVGTTNFSRSLFEKQGLLDHDPIKHNHNLHNLNTFLNINRNKLIVNCFRNPFDRNISFFFDTFTKNFFPKMFLCEIKDLNKYSSEYIINHFYERMYLIENYYTEWYQKFFEKTNININDINLNKGIQLFKINENTYILLSVLEKYSNNIPILEKFLTFNLKNHANKREEKDELQLEIYSNFKKKIIFNDDYKKKILDNNLNKSIYSEEELQNFTNKYIYNMIKVSDYIVDFLSKNSLNTLFTLTGGFSMHLNDSFGKHGSFDIYYQHHEQACAYSAVGFTKTNSKPCVVCTTAGVAATNAISPCLVAYQDSLPILFISGQSKSIELTRFLEKDNPKMKLRHYAGQDCDIISMVKPITKYAKEITSISEIKDTLTEAIKHMINGRPGPVWISVPVDIQGYFMNELDIPLIEKDIMNFTPNMDDFKLIDNMLKESKRPLIIAGNGVKMSLCNKKFKTFLDKYKIPIVISFHGTDLLENDSEYYVGKVGLIGDRAGNFALQNCDLLISLGCRMSQGIVGYNTNTFAREAKIIYIDNDENELEKNNINYSLKINMDLNLFFDYFKFDNYDYSDWIKKCNHWKDMWQFELPKDISDIKGINPYYALKIFFELAPCNKNIICSSGSIVTNIWHMVKIKENDKFIISSQGDMGFELTAAIGSSIAEKDHHTIPILGEGSFQFNIQELQTIVHKKIPMKILLMNNNSYGANVITQGLYFKNKYGSDSDSDLTFPETEKIAKAYNIKYICARKNEELEQIFEQFLKSEETIICEVFSCVQQRVPKLSAIKNDDGTFSSRPFEDMEPFLDREEFKNEMIINII